MEDVKILDEIKGVLREWFEIEPHTVGPESLLREELGLDSLDIVDFVVVLEKQFGFKVARAEDEPVMRNFKNLSDVVSFTKNKLPH